MEKKTGILGRGPLSFLIRTSLDFQPLFRENEPEIEPVYSHTGNTRSQGNPG